MRRFAEIDVAASFPPDTEQDFPKAVHDNPLNTMDNHQITRNNTSKYHGTSQSRVENARPAHPIATFVAIPPVAYLLR